MINRITLSFIPNGLEKLVLHLPGPLGDTVGKIMREDQAVGVGS